MKSSCQPIEPENSENRQTQAIDKADIKPTKTRTAVLDIVLFGLFTAILFAVQVGLAFLPNIELVTPLLIVFTLVLGKKVFAPLYAFVVLEGIFYGFHIWWIAYLYVWAVLVMITLLLKKLDSAFLFAVTAAIFGLLFGTMTSLPYLFIGGWEMFVTTVVAGLSFDLVHCAGNFALTLILYRPLKLLLSKLYKTPQRGQY
ncbi:MAG: hypothetical protein LBS36_12710 [Oscillospiraceae bacterium]|jgi:energy-coupling factor transport system substrate-specific component|nr:hypothetical protein [Oscillospiraceae bacterium]